MLGRALVCAVACCWLVSARAESDRVAAYGRVSAGERPVQVAIPYYAGAPQTISELLVKEGDRVTRGQRLAVTQSRALAEAEVAVAKAHLAVAEERLCSLSAGPKGEEVAAQEAQIKALDADARAEKAKKLPDGDAAKNEALARREAATARASVAQHQLAAVRETRPADLAIAKAEVEEARAAVPRAETLLATTEITAPSDGQVLKIVSYPGEGAGKPLLELGDAGAMLIKAELNARDARRVKPGARATIKNDAWTGEIAGAVLHVSPRVERSALTAPSTFANVDRQIVEATIQPDSADKLAGLSGAEVTVVIEPAAP